MIVQRITNVGGKEIIQQAKVLKEIAADFSKEKTHYLVEFIRDGIQFKSLWAKALVSVPSKEII